MDKINEFMQANNLKYRDETAQQMFENHITQFVKRQETKEGLDVELDPEMLNSLDKTLLDQSQEIIDILMEEEVKDLDKEKFLIATHIMMMEAK